MTWTETNLDPIYAVLGVDVTLTPPAGSATGLVAMDKSAGEAIERGDGAFPVLVPAARLRMAELIAAGLTRENLDEGVLVMNGKTWTIESHQPLPSPLGEDDGEVVLVLTRVTA